MNTRRSGRQRERGQVLVIVAGGAIALILLMGLVLDVGVAVFNRRDGQNVSDIMSLAATRYVADVHRGVPQTDASITSTFLALQKSADENDCLTAGEVPCTWQAWFVGASATGPVDLSPGPIAADLGRPRQALGVRVSVTRQPKTFVVGFIGLPHWDVTPSDRHRQAPDHGACRAAPADRVQGRPIEPIPAGQVYDLTDGKDLPGGFGWLSWTDPTIPMRWQPACAPRTTRPSPSRTRSRVIPARATAAMSGPAWMAGSRRARPS